MSTPAQPQQPARRVGDAERDDAAGLLREHMAAGRLDFAEFDDRLGRAMSARTEPELRTLFDDLPGRRPGEPEAALVPAVGWTPPPLPAPRPRPWWTSGWLFVAALLISMVSRGELGGLIPAAAVWVWWLGPTLWRHQEQQRTAREQLDGPHPPEPPYRPLGR